MKRIGLALFMVFVLSGVALAGRIDILSTEITVDPLVRGYAAMSDQQVLDDIKLVNRPINERPIDSLIKFLILDNTYKEDDGTDTQDRAIWRRIKEVVALSDTPSGAVANPWGATALGTITEIQQIKTHQLFSYFTLMAQGGLDIDVSDSNFQVYLTGAVSAGCMSTAQKDALIALANNLQSREQELGISGTKLGHITEARLP